MLPRDNENADPSQNPFVLSDVPNDPNDDASSAARVSKTASALIISASDKAGMDGIDRSKIDAIILRESGNSFFMQQQRKRDEQVNQKIEKMLQDLKMKNQSGHAWKRVVEKDLEMEIHDHLQARPKFSTCVVVDLDMFYMACELLTRPELREKPCCVGDSMITTSNYVARKYGVRSAMAGFIGDKLVEELSGGTEKLIHTPHNFELYTEKSHQVRSVLSEYDPDMKVYSLDEAYIDIGPYLTMRLQNMRHEDIVQQLRRNYDLRSSHDQEREEVVPQKTENIPKVICEALLLYPHDIVFQTTIDVVKEMRGKVFDRTGGLTCSAGIAPNFMLAKIASDRNKPNGQHAVGPSQSEVISFLHPLSIRKVGGIGRVTEKMLNALGITTVQEMYSERASVRFCFKPATARFLLRASLGCGSTESKEDEQDDIGRKGISREQTFGSGKLWTEIRNKLEVICHHLAADMVKENLWAHTVTVKVKLHTFDVRSRSRSLTRGVYVQNANELVKISLELLREVRQELGKESFNLRLLGVRCSNFQAEHERISASQMKIMQYFDKSNPKPCAATYPVSCEQQQQQRQQQQQLEYQLHGLSSTTNKEIKISSSLSENKNVASLLVSCPLCGKMLNSENNAALNSHIDACLNEPEIRKVTKSEPQKFQPKKKQRIQDFFKR